MSVTVTYASTVQTAETLETNVGAVATSSRLTHSGYDESATLNSTSNPPATKCAYFLLTLTAGAATVNLAALTGTNGVTVDGTGLRVQILRVKNLGANSLTIVPGASNGIDLPAAGASIPVPAGAHVTYYLADSGPDIAAGDRTLDVTGTGTQTSEWSIVLG